jgi:peptidoglycan/LPS O-acetylase OafA/YrhL
LGNVSYSLYLIHVTVLVTVAPRLSHVPTGLVLPIALGSVAVASFALYFLVERPAQKFAKFAIRRV